MKCIYCGDAIPGTPVKQSNDYFCSLECANLHAGYPSDEEEDGYYEEVDISESFGEEYDE